MRRGKVASQQASPPVVGYLRQPARPGRYHGGPSPAERRNALVQVLGFVAMFALVVNFLVGTLAALAFLLASAALVATGPFDALNGVLRIAPLLALPLLAIMSAQWSEAPGISTRGGLQVLLTMICGAVIGWRCSERTMLLGLFAGLLAVCLTAVPQIPFGLQRGFPIQGAFASKNAFAIHAQFLEVFALAVAGDRTHHWAMRLLGGFSLILSLLLVYLAHSGGALVLAVLTLGLFPAFYVFARLKLWSRIVVVSVVAVGLLAAAILAPQIAQLINWIRTDVLGKDATLTGRTELWSVANDLIAERPLLGHGYFAFWRLGNPDAEALWRMFGVTRGGGFNFHNELVEIAVGLGYVGLGLLMVLCLVVAGAAVIRHITRPSFYGAVALTALVSIYARAFVETGLIAPFSIVLAYWVAIASRSIGQGEGKARMELSPRQWMGTSRSDRARIARRAALPRRNLRGRAGLLSD